MIVYHNFTFKADIRPPHLISIRQLSIAAHGLLVKAVEASASRSTMADINTTVTGYWQTVQAIHEYIVSQLYLIIGTCMLLVLAAALHYFLFSRRQRTASGSGLVSVVPESVNFHLTRECNYKCGFCFHTAKTSHLLGTAEAKRGLQMLKDAGYCSFAVACLSCLHNVHLI